MSTGTVAVGQCLASQAEAFALHCGSLGGVGGSGVMSCDGPDASATLSASEGGAVTVPYVLRVESALGATTRVATADLQACERYDAAYWAPYIATFWAVLISILAVRLAYTRIFYARDSL
jgi:hypothetical protein